jgi:hypothetical protein
MHLKDSLKSKILFQPSLSQLDLLHFQSKALSSEEASDNAVLFKAPNSSKNCLKKNNSLYNFHSTSKGDNKLTEDNNQKSTKQSRINSSIKKQSNDSKVLRNLNT